MIFEETFTVEHRVGNPTYTAYLPHNLMSFSNYKCLDTLSHVTTIKNALSIITKGIEGTPINDYSVVRKERGHPLHENPIIWMSPSTDGPVQESRYGNVSFNVNNAELINQFENLNFYYVEFLQYINELAVRVLVTDNNYHDQLLLQFYPENQSDVICFDDAEQKWKSAATYDYQKITVEFIIDYKLTFNEIGFVSVNSRRPIITKNQHGRDVVTGYHPVFEDGDLAYLFFTLVKYLFVTLKEKGVYMMVPYNEIHEEMRILENNVLKGRLIDSLRRIIARYPRKDWEGEESENDLNADQAIQQFRFDVFNYQNKQDLDWNNSYLVNHLIYLFKDRNECPSAIACIVKLHDKMANNYQEKKHFEANFGEIISIFLNHFTKEEGEELKNRMIEFVQNFG